MLTREQLTAAQGLVYQHMQPTPQYAWPLLAEALGCEVWVKHENHTPTGAFKVRGGLNYLAQWQAGGKPTSIVTATRGNHGQSIPFAARAHDIPVKVYVPHGNSQEKNAAMRAWGAELVEEGVDFDVARVAAQEFASATRAHSVPSFHPLLVRGVATYGAELFDAVPDLGTVYVPIGMGSGAASLVAVRDLLGSRADIVGVVSDQADAFALSLEQGRIVETNSAHTFADGMATRVPNPDAFAYLREGLTRIVRVSDAEIAQAMRLLYRTAHNIAEGAGAAATAALMHELQNTPGVVRAPAAVILTGGNIDQAWFSQVLAGGVPEV